MSATTTLFRPVGVKELELIYQSGMKSFPPRLDWQPIFYPVLNSPYAEQIALEWNTKDEFSGYAGFVTAFDLPAEYLTQFEVQEVGGKIHQELWVPAEQLQEFNSKIAGSIRIVKAFYGVQFQMSVSLQNILLQTSFNKPLNSNIQWVVQKNLTSEDVFDQLRDACVSIGANYAEVVIVPFSEALPQFDRNKRSIFYGSTTIGQLVMKERDLKDGFFFSPETFSMELYFSHWGEHMLNYGAAIIPFSDVTSLSGEDDKLVFVRPDDDSKSFAGIVMTVDELKSWRDNLNMAGSPQLTLETKIVVSEPLHIKSEWRLWIVDKRVVASSKYRENFKLKKEKGCPDDVLKFAEARCSEFTPNDVFVMDIALCGDTYYIIECGCVNSAGFYAADILSVVQNVTDYFVMKEA